MSRYHTTPRPLSINITWPPKYRQPKSLPACMKLLNLTIKYDFQWQKFPLVLKFWYAVPTILLSKAPLSIWRNLRMSPSPQSRWIDTYHKWWLKVQRVSSSTIIAVQWEGRGEADTLQTYSTAEQAMVQDGTNNNNYAGRIINSSLVGMEINRHCKWGSNSSSCLLTPLMGRLGNSTTRHRQHTTICSESELQCKLLVRLRVPLD
jgi:hypothetical protein